ncbi:MAG: PAS domain S-box protein [Deltaproteobacteria bacterium]|nr:PAS domain S-box protein [Deltaproteobacteria bacterium]
MSDVCVKSSSTVVRPESNVLLTPEPLLAAFLESAPDAIIVIDQLGRIVVANAQVRRLFGYEPAELLGHPVEVLVPQRFRGGHIAHREGYARAPRPRLMGDSVSDENPLYGCRRDGSEFPVGISLSSVQTPLGAFVLADIRDISAQIEASRRIRALCQDLEAKVAEREALNAELESFSYSVSHDLRAPLRAIDGFSKILREDYAPSLPDEAVRYLSIISESATQMGALIDDLLRFSRLGRQSLVRQNVRVEDVVRSAWSELSAFVDACEPAPELFVSNSIGGCQADPALLKQVFVNLLSNALKYRRPGYAVSIEVGATASGDGDGSSEVAYYVKDNGVGFDMKYSNKLFRVFQRLHGAEYEGTGIGLALVQRIVSRHGGRVWATSEPNLGATFFFTISRGVHESVD